MGLDSSFEIKTKFTLANRLALIDNEIMENFEKKISEIQT
ncbi:MAG: hypothetical protein FJY21_06675 [Bacteroidetes bacterium]|nr:hypothetical protein [Bacteroidota bacterium]